MTLNESPAGSDGGVTQPLLTVGLLPVVIVSINNEPQSDVAVKPTWGKLPPCGTPIYGANAPPQLQKKFVKQGCKDAWAGVLFLLVLLGTIIAAGILGATYDAQVLQNCEYDGGSSFHGGSWAYANAKPRRGHARGFGAQQFYAGSGQDLPLHGNIEPTQAGSGSGYPTQEPGSGSGWAPSTQAGSGSGWAPTTQAGSGSGWVPTTAGSGSGSGFVTTTAAPTESCNTQEPDSGSNAIMTTGAGSGSGAFPTTEAPGSGSNFYPTTTEAGSGSGGAIPTTQGGSGSSCYTAEPATAESGSGSGYNPQPPTWPTSYPWWPTPNPYEGASGQGSSSFGMAPCSFFATGPIWMGASIGASLWMALVSIALMRLAPKAYIVAANVLLIALYITGGSFELGFGFVPNGVVLLIVAFFHALWFFLVRRRIAFAAALLGQSVKTVSTNWGSFLTSFAALIALTAYCSAWVFAAVPVTTIAFVQSNGSNAATVLTFGAFLLVFFWSTQVLINIVHVTASGGVATWYFAGDAAMPSKPSVAALKRALTTSFGSICLGSAVVAILKLIHAILRASTRQINCLSCVSMCLIVLIERLMQWFNVYAFTHVAIYGSSYVEAAKQTWDMIENFGWSAVFNDSLVFPVLSMTTLLNSLAIGYGVFRIEGANGAALVLGLTCATIAYVVHVVLFRVVYSGVVTIFVCYAECPEALAVSNPEFNAKVEEAIEPLKNSRINV